MEHVPVSPSVGLLRGCLQLSGESGARWSNAMLSPMQDHVDQGGAEVVEQRWGRNASLFESLAGVERP